MKEVYAKLDEKNKKYTKKFPESDGIVRKSYCRSCGKLRSGTGAYGWYDVEICRAIAQVTIPTEAIIIIPAARHQAKQRLLQMAIIQTQQNQMQIKQRRLRLRRDRKSVV